MILYNTVEQEEVLNQFFNIVNIKGESTALEKFTEYLQQIVENKIGKFVLIAIINKLNDLPSKQRCLEIQIDNENPDFTRPTLKTLAKIKFSTVLSKCYVINLSIDSKQTVENDSFQDVLLFHEILHWARYLVSITSPCSDRDRENSQSFFHPILDDHPRFSSWIGQLKRHYSIALANSAKIKFLDLFYVQAPQFPFPELNCWKQCLTQNDSGLIPLNSHCINLITENKPSKNDSQVIGNLTMPRLNVEEIRNIVGGKSSDGGQPDIDNIVRNVICENGYRLVARLPLRYGHVQTSCKIDNHVIEWCSRRAYYCLQVVEGLGG